MLDFIRIGCAVPEVTVGDVEKNAERICAMITQADAQGADVVLFPELALTGCSCGDLFAQQTLWTAVKQGLCRVADAAAAHPALWIVVGAPVLLNGKLLNCALVLHSGRICGVVPKTDLSGEEGRWFVSGADLKETAAGLEVFDREHFGFTSLGTDLLFEIGDGAVLGIEIGDALASPVPSSALLTVNGANVILNPTALCCTAGARERWQRAAVCRSEAGICIYAASSAGWTESTSDGVYAGCSLIAENGRILARQEELPASDYLMVTDCDLGRVNAARQRSDAFRQAAARYGSREYLIEPMRGEGTLRGDGSRYPVSKLPFIPETRAEREAYCREVFQIQVTGLKRRLQAINCNPVLGISGGLDSTLALLVAVEAVRQLGRSAGTVYGVTMPCFGTSDRTYRNAWDLMNKLGITSKEISIKNAVSVHFEDIGHDPAVHNTTYENAQARERTQILMDYSGTVSGIVVGTGDLSELALGWCTYNGDHMSMYGVNGSIPKTLIRWIIQAVADLPAFAPAKATLLDVLDTPISPELLPPDASGKIAQQTEDLVGPYALHDFFLYYVLGFGFSPEKIYALACYAFAQDFDRATIKKWIKSFYRRFFTQQFKRNCQPDGVKAISFSLSPRTDWRMPSDASARIWLDAVERL